MMIKVALRAAVLAAAVALTGCGGGQSASVAPAATEAPAATAAGGPVTLTAAPGTVVVAHGGGQETYQVSSCSSTTPSADMAGLLAMVGIFGGNPWGVQTNATANVTKSSGAFSGTFSGTDEISGGMVEGAFACQ